MSDHRIEPNKVTKPIQLLAAWLVGLIVIDGGFLTAALSIGEGTWERGALVVAAIANVPIFLAALFLLQTRFRAELQEDSFYFQYISRKTDTVVSLSEEDIKSNSRVIEQGDFLQPLPQLQGADESSRYWSQWKVGLNDHREDFLEIRNALRTAGIPVKIAFGKINGTRKPDRWVIAINEKINFSRTIQLLKALAPFSFDGFHRWTPIPDAGEDEDVYIGAYGEMDYTRVTPALAKLFDQDVEELDFEYYVRANMTKAAIES